ncbi:MAG: catalase [Clostridiales bacterium]|jgi:catalase|nr:catalase [Clostridiales bacterium]
MKENRLTFKSGAPVPNHQDVMTAGPRGSLVVQDAWFMEKMAHFNREVIPERRMHAKGSGAFGKFTVTHDITKYTKADLFSEIGKETDIFVRFSTVAGERGAADAERDIRGFALKFYTNEGNWDLVGNNTPVFFIRDPIHFPDLNHAVKRDPRTNMRDPMNNWDFWSMLPEALHQITIVMSDRGIPDGYRHMHGFGSHTYSFVNAENERFWVKFHFKTLQGIRNLTNEEAAAIVAKDRESAQRDLYEAIEAGDFPKWTFEVQIMTQEQAKNHKDNPFDITKVWSQKEYPRIPVGIFELNRNPENYHADVEQAAFNPATVVPGIGVSPDKLLQGRLFAYGDAARYRLGINHHQIPVNAAKCPFHAYHRDGVMRVDGNYGSTKGYFPNSFDNWQDQPEFSEPPFEADGDIDHHSRYYEGDDVFYQAGDLYRLMTEDKKAALISNTAGDIAPVTDNIKYRHAAHCYMADEEYGTRLAAALELDLAKVKELAEIRDHDERLRRTHSKVWAK